jgi:hypothetical protein
LLAGADTRVDAPSSRATTEEILYFSLLIFSIDLL